MDIMVEILPYRPEFREMFERLNRQWLEEYSLLEPVDLEYLQDPERHVLSPGGQIFFAVVNDQIVGTCAAIIVSPSSIELAKLAVSPAFQKHGVGRLLCEHVLKFARELGAAQVVLTSNTKLKAGIRLYESMGFQHEPVPENIPYATADVYMTLNLVRAT